MPVIDREGPYRFFFYSHEPNEPPHVHVQRDRSLAKFWLDPVRLAGSRRFPAYELRRIRRYNRRKTREIPGGLVWLVRRLMFPSPRMYG